ncbi:hypothetical protein H4Q26_006805 [Puccinia striiformis f. sp. tritici PST-130]|nr:hypothetical protein H4Q26_006805 [Puccinia striiformis f. sp. tritici PST-130]
MYHKDARKNRRAFQTNKSIKDKFKHLYQTKKLTGDPTHKDFIRDAKATFQEMCNCPSTYENIDEDMNENDKEYKSDDERNGVGADVTIEADLKLGFSSNDPVGILFPVQTLERERTSVSLHSIMYSQFRPEKLTLCYLFFPVTGLTNLNSQDHKRLACQSLSDVMFNSNSIDLQSTTDLAESSEFLLDHQTSRSNNKHHATTQNQEPHLSQPNDSIRPRLLKRISLPLKDNSHIV